MRKLILKKRLPNVMEIAEIILDETHSTRSQKLWNQLKPKSLSINTGLDFHVGKLCSNVPILFRMFRTNPDLSKLAND